MPSITLRSSGLPIVPSIISFFIPVHAAEEQSRDRPDLESSFQFFFVVYIDFIDVEFSVVFFCKLIEYRLQTFAIAAPGEHESLRYKVCRLRISNLWGLSSKFPTRCINSVFVNSIGVMLFPFIIIKTKIGIIWFAL